MSSSVSIITIVLILALLGINIYMRTVIIRKYKALRNRGLDLDPSVLFNKKKRRAYIQQVHPDNATELNSFGDSLDKLLIGVIGAFLMIVLCCGYIYLKTA